MFKMQTESYADVFCMYNWVTEYHVFYSWVYCGVAAS